MKAIEFIYLAVVAEISELNNLIEQQVQFGRRVIQKNKWTKEQKNMRIVYARSSSHNVQVMLV